MPLSDSHPERRNLVVTSMAFIVYFAADGHLADSMLRLAIVNVTFGKPAVLASIAWGILGWFTLRFWQTTKATYITNFKRELSDAKLPHWLFRRAVSTVSRNEAAKSFTGKLGTSIEPYGLRKEGNTWLVTCAVIVLDNGHRVQVHSENAELRGLHLWFAVAWGFITRTVVGNAAAEYLAPYVLLAAAVSAPLWSRLL